jgi:hypothetical protein
MGPVSGLDNFSQSFVILQPFFKLDSIADNVADHSIITSPFDISTLNSLISSSLSPDAPSGIL